ncbi:MFS transporter [Ktedonobacter robiniae]|uniref:MFS transporter n=1 Tax=Ktedonobacter robiniae TaxID=2778365 RepID=A0ABQ3UN06_9CHLR|nr:MFS transporter [Ktedonobacter robiniae]GHO54095.1 MFS transporter [Ktedonobacter robiniae]
MNDSVMESSAEGNTLATSVLEPRPWRRWLAAFFGYTASSRVLLTSAIWMIYLAAQGYSPFVIGLFEMVFHIAKFVAEVPTGIFADLLGRRKSLILYCLISAIDSLLYLHPTAPFMLLAFALSGISFAFLGGANDALLWTLTGYADAQRQSQLYSKLMSWTLMVSLVSEMVGTTLGGYLGSIMQTLPFICRALICLVSILPLCLLPEGIEERQPEERINVLAHLGAGLRIVWNTPAILGLILISGLTESCGTTIYFYVQLQLHGLGFALSAVGFIIALSNLSQFLFTAMVPVMMRKIPERWLLPLAVLTQATGLLLMMQPQMLPSLLGFLIFFQAATAVLYPALSTYINQRCPEAQRATVLSFQTGLFSLAMIVIFPLFGLGITHSSYSVVYGWTVLALLLGGLGTVFLVRLRQWHVKMK